MEKLFGIEINSLLLGLLGILSAIFIMLAFTALRNPVLFKMGVRNITRRPAQTFLILFGLMLATLLFSAALVTGDTMTYSVEKNAVENLGLIDLTVQPKKIEGDQPSALTVTGGGLLNKKDLHKVKEVLNGSNLDDGIAPLVTAQVPAQSSKSRKNIPALGLVGLDRNHNDLFGQFIDKNNKKLSLSGLDAGEVYINKKAADKLDAKQGDKIKIFTGSGTVSVTVKGVIEQGAVPANGPSAVMSMKRAQKLLAMNEGYTSILISGKGDEKTGAKHSIAIARKLRPLYKDSPFEAEETKKEILDQAKEASSTFTTIFLVFGQFSMMAGIMLIFLIFVMLAAERKVELGIMRAIGLQRRDLLKIFTFEGTVYALLSAVIGSALGIVVGMGMVKVLTAAFGQMEDFPLTFYFTTKSLVIAYAMGVISTFLIVFLSAWKAGKINIVRAVRDLPEPSKAKKGIKRFLILIAAFILGGLIMSGGLQGKQTAPFMIGLTLLLIATPLLAIWIRLPERAAYTISGLSITIAWLLPEKTVAKVIPGFDSWSGGIELFFISGISIITGAIWVVMYNSDILLSAVNLVFGRFRGLPPILRIAINYPMKNRVRTGLALAMFSLVMFTIIFMSSLLGSLNTVFNDYDRFSGNYDIRGTTGYSNTVNDVQKQLDNMASLNSSDVDAVGSFSAAPAAFKQDTRKSKKWADSIIFGIDKGYAQSTGYKIVLRSSKYKSDREIWNALISEPDAAIVHASLVPAKTSYNMGQPEPPFRLSGLFLEDKKLPDIIMQVKNASTGKITKLKVIGVVEQNAFYANNGVMISQKNVSKIMGTKVPATTFWFRFKPGTDLNKADKALSSTFYKNGMETTLLSEEVGNMMRANLMMNRLLQGFMGLGLVVGIAALGVIASRSVVERRRQIGMLRAIGFRRGMVKGVFILESSFVSLLGIVVGSVLALILASNVTEELTKEMPGISHIIPWAEVTAISAAAYLIAMLATYLPARQASKVFPAEALRYE